MENMEIDVNREKEAELLITSRRMFEHAKTLREILLLEYD